MQKQSHKFHCTIECFSLRRSMLGFIICWKYPKKLFSSAVFIFLTIIKLLNILEIFSKATDVPWYMSLHWTKHTSMTSLFKMISHHKSRCCLRYSMWFSDFEVWLLFWSNKNNIIIMNLIATCYNWLVLTHLCISRVYLSK